MHQFQHAIFLDPPKTGTSFVSDVLGRHAVGENILMKHKPARQVPLAEGRFVFTSIRNPFDFYRSTYRYAMRKDGGGRKDMYRYYGQGVVERTLNGTQGGFERWLGLFMDLHEAGDEKFVPTKGWEVVGRYTYRYMKLALPQGRNFAPTPQGLRDRYSVMLPQAYVRTDQINDDLAALVRGPLAPNFDDPEKIAKLVKLHRPINVGAQKNRPLQVPANLKRRIRAAEQTMFEIWDSLSVNAKTGIVTSNLHGGEDATA